MTDDAAPPFDGDASWRAVHRLANGDEVLVRPIVPEDREELRRAFHRTSARTKYLRFLGVVGDLDDGMLDYLTRVDQRDHVALVATIASPDLKSERGIGVARFIRIADEPTVAEGAITVADDMQRKGVGTLLATELGRAAVLRGIATMRAEVLESNHAMRAILEHAGAKRGPARDGTIAYDLALPQETPRTFADVLRGAAETMAMTIRRLAPPGHELRAPAPKRE